MSKKLLKSINSINKAPVLQIID